MNTFPLVCWLVVDVDLSALCWPHRQRQIGAGIILILQQCWHLRGPRGGSLGQRKLDQEDKWWLPSYIVFLTQVSHLPHDLPLGLRGCNVEASERKVWELAFSSKNLCSICCSVSLWCLSVVNMLSLIWQIFYSRGLSTTSGHSWGTDMQKFSRKGAHY